jgi:hypothetical protein
VPKQLLLSVALVLAGNSSPSLIAGESDVGGCRATDAAWNTSLERFARRTELDRDLLKTSAAGSDCVAGLARRLLADWALAPDDPLLQRPLLAWQPTFSAVQGGKARRLAAAVVGVLEVDSRGLVQAASLKFSTGDPDVDKRVIAGLRQSRFRPARRDGTWVASQAISTIHLGLH